MITVSTSITSISTTVFGKQFCTVMMRFSWCGRHASYHDHIMYMWRGSWKIKVVSEEHFSAFIVPFILWKFERVNQLENICSHVFGLKVKFRF